MIVGLLALFTYMYRYMNIGIHIYMITYICKSLPTRAGEVEEEGKGRGREGKG